MIDDNDKYCLNCGKKTQIGYESGNELRNYHTDGSYYMVCPQCGHSMEEGYLSSARPIKWKKINAPFFQRYDKINDDASNMHFWSNNKLLAHRCEKCRIIQSNY